MLQIQLPRLGRKKACKLQVGLQHLQISGLEHT